MSKYVVRRLLQLIPTALGVSLLVFLIMKLSPGSPAQMIAGPDASEEVIRQIEESLGLDRPLHIQYFSWLKKAASGDLGESIRRRTPVVQEIARFLPNTMVLASGAVLLGTVLGLLFGVLSAVFRGRLLDRLVMFLAVCGISTPSFVRALGLMWLFAVWRRWFPISGMADAPLLSLENFRHMVLPMLALSVQTTATLARIGRSTLLEVLGQDYVRTARSKGLGEGAILFKHALKNAMLPLVTVIGFEIGFLFSGAVITETVFAWPGIGREVVAAILARDFPMVQGMVLMLALVYVLANLLVDLTYAYLDPRIKYT